MKRILCAIALVFAAGCAGTYNLDYDERTISITSEPTGADVFQTNPFTGKRVFLGRTPIRDKKVEVVGNASYTNLSPEQSAEVLQRIGVVEVVVQKPGYSKYRGQLQTRQGDVAKHHIKLDPK